MKKEKTLKKNVSVILKKETFDKVKILADSEERTMSQMIRKLVNLALNDYK